MGCRFRPRSRWILAITLLADPDRLGQVLRALIDNAVKFSDGRGVVEVRAAPGGTGHGRVEVADQGIGIPDADVPRIFDRFFQVDNTSTRRFGGTGMGLALVKRVVAGARRDDRLSRPASGRERGYSCAGRSVSTWCRRRRSKRPDSIVAGAGTMRVVALGGALAVPCTRNPL